MPDFFLHPQSIDHLTFRRRSGAYRLRQFPYQTEPRSLADSLIEVATGGAWSVDDLDADITLEATAGRVLVVPGERRHNLRMVRGRPMHSRWALVALEDRFGRDLLARLPRAIVLPRIASKRASLLLKKLESPYRTDVAERIALQRLSLELVSIILAHSPLPTVAAPTLQELRMEPVLRYIRAHLNEPLSREILARQVHLSPTRFHYVFADAVGQSPMKYVMAQRMRRARQLLLSTLLSSKEIGRQCGFTSSAHFTRVFTTSTGLSPLAYRAQITSA